MSQKMHQWTSRLLAVMMSAAMAVSVVTPTAIFAAPSAGSKAIDLKAEDAVSAPVVEIAEVAEEDEVQNAVVDGRLGITELPELNQDNLAEIMAERIAATKTDKTVIPMLWQGLLEQKIMVGEEERTAKIYVPENTPQGTTFVLMNLPEGQTNTLGWMYNSGWIQLADSYGFCLFVLEPGEGGWGTPEEEMPYFQAGYSAERAGIYLMAGPSVYVVGYGAVGSNLQKIAMANPLSIAAAAFVGANEIDDAYLEAMAEKSFDREGRDYGVMYNEVPVPVMLANSDEKLVNYWKGVSSADKEVSSTETMTFWQQSEDSMFTPEGNIVLVGDVKGAPGATSIASFLNRYYRYGGGPKSNMIANKVDYDKLGVEFRTFTDSNGIDREYMVYVPESIRGSEEGAPLVIAYHGAQTSMRNFFENTLYYRIADSGKFIVVFPESTLIPVAAALTGGLTKAYRPLWQLENPEMIDTEEVYADELLDDIIANYNVDESRIYCTGHSMGSMMTNYLGTSKVSDRFAACGSTSGPLNGEASYDYEEAVPMFLTMAQYDMWPYDISGETGVTAAIDNWLVRNGLATADDAAEVRAEPDEEYVEGRYNNSVWKNENGVPVVRYAWVTAKDHVNIVDENVTMWTQWFSKWTKTDNGNRAYEGKVQPVKLTDANVPKIDRTRGMVLPLTGYLSQDIQVGDKDRTVSLYIGKGAPIRCYMSIINVPEGVDTYEFLEKTGWIDLMDERKEGVFVLEPGEGGWGTPDEEQEYIAAAMAAYNTRKWYSNYGESYAVGYGEGGSALQQYVMSKPTAFIAGTFYNASNISKDFMDENAATVNDAQTEILKGEIPVPVYLYGTNEDVVVYWLAANRCSGEGESVENGTLYTQSEDCLQTSYTKDVKSIVYIGRALDSPYTPEFTRAAYEKMAVYTRYENTWANGNALMLRPDYEELGVEFYDYDQDGFKRSYMVYKPASAPEENIPVVYLMAGNTQSMTVFFDSTSWWQVADDYGFMIVIPSEQFNSAVDLTWNITDYQPGSETAIADDVAFLKDIIAEVDANYNTDPGRRYVSGQSYGSMWTNYCALHMSDYFTAFGSTSGPISFDIDGTEDTDIVPVWLYAGQYDIFDWDFTKDVTEGFSLKKTVEYYLDRNGLGGLEDYEKTAEDRYTTYTWANEDGIPLYVFTQTAGRNHNCVPSEPRLIWEKWFSKWTKESGIRSYEGTPIASMRGALTPVHITDEAFATAKYVGQKNPFTGYFYTEIEVGGEQKTIKFYVPKDSHWGLYYVLMNAPEGTSADQFLVDSGWAQLAEQEQFGIVIFDEELDSESEKEAFIEAAYKFMSSAKFFKPGTSYYAVGYGETGKMVERFVMRNPMTFGSAAFIDAGDMSYSQLNMIGKEKADSRTSVLKSEVPTPAYIVESDVADAKNVIDYWKTTNNVVDIPEEGEYGESVYTQETDTMFTTYFNNLKVATLEKEADYSDASLAKGIWNFMKEYFSYGSVATGWITGERADYDELGVKFKTFEQDGYLREYMVYVPESAAQKDAAPAVFVAPGAGSTDTFMFDTSMWWKVAQLNGFIVVELTAPVTGNSTTSLHSVSWDSHSDRDLNYIKTVVEQVKADYNVDASRLYFTGQSQGSVLSHFVGMNLPEIFAAIGSTSAGINAGMISVNDSTTPIPYKLIVGEYDVMSWDFSGSDAQTRKTVAHWVRTNKGGIPDDGYKTVSTLDDGGRYVSYIWSNSQDIPVFDFTECHDRGHSVVVTDMGELWKWFEHYSQDEDDNTYYDGQLIDFSDKIESVDVATLEAPKVDYTRGNHQEYTGYYRQTINVNNADRTVKYYIPENMKIRGYFTIITVPEEIDTEAFLIESGWKDISDETGDGIVLLEPVAGVWGTVDEEKAYVDAAIKTFEAGTYFKLFGEHYLVGYDGNGGTALQMYAVENPLRVISAAFINASNISEEFFEEAGKATLPYSASVMSDVTKAEIPIPMIIVENDLSKAAAALSYWKKANAVEEEGFAVEANVKVYFQEDPQSSIVTAYNNIYSYVGEVTLAGAVTDKELTEFIRSNIASFTRYENNYIGGNVLNDRAELYDEEYFKTVTFEQTFEGVTYAREYIVYVPYGVQSPAPVVYVFPGGSQTDNVFMDATGWWKVARDEGFILVMTMAQEGGPMSPSWNISDNSYDIDYMKQVIAQVDEAYDTDPSRRYCTGQSMGSLMSEQSAIEMPEYYAAIGSTSACMSKDQIGAYAEPADGIIPYYLILGEYDVDNWDFQQTGEDMNKCSSIVSYLLGRNGFTDASKFDEKVVDGRYTTYVWNNAAGQPLFQFGQTALRNHNCIQSEMPMLYEWFSHWSIEGGVRKYDGTPVGTEVEKDPVSEFVSDLYSTCLGRTGRSHEIDTWADLLKSGDVTGAKTAYGFFFSPEYINSNKSNREYVTDLYKAIMGREPDTEGLETWISYLEKGTSREKVFAGFVNSDEFKADCAAHNINPGTYKSEKAVDINPDVTAFVVRLYKVALGRDFDANGLEDWTFSLLNKQATGSRVAEGFLTSQEFKNRDLSDEDFVEVLYHTMFDRAPDVEGFNGWISVLNDGASREQVVKGFTKSVEFANLCSAFGIEQ